jgi:hypothetical protein
MKWIFQLFRKRTQEDLKIPIKTKHYSQFNWTPVINFETGGRSYYNSRLKTPTWPGGASGVTIGIGADLGYMTLNEFDTYFSSFFSKSDADRLRKTIGVKGSAAKSLIRPLSDIILTWENAEIAFKRWTLPKFYNLANRIWPNLENLCENAQVALVSIVFNRGGSLSGPSRREMLNIKDLVAKKDYVGISNEIKNMKRLWMNRGLDGLLKRRDIESEMVLTCR